MSDQEVLGTFFGIPVVMNERLILKDGRDLGVVVDQGLFDPVFVLLKPDNTTTVIELDHYYE